MVEGDFDSDRIETVYLQTKNLTDDGSLASQSRINSIFFTDTLLRTVYNEFLTISLSRPQEPGPVGAEYTPLP